MTNVLKSLNDLPPDSELQKALDNEPGTLDSLLVRAIQYWNNSTDPVVTTPFTGPVLRMYQYSNSIEGFTDYTRHFPIVRSGMMKINLNHHISVVLYEGQLDKIPFEPYKTISDNVLTKELTELIPLGSDGLSGPFTIDKHSAFIVFNDAYKLVQTHESRGADYQYRLSADCLNICTEKQDKLHLLTTSSRNLAYAVFKQMYFTVNPTLGHLDAVTEALITNMVNSSSLSSAIREGSRAPAEYQIAIPREYAKEISEHIEITDSEIKLSFFSEDINLRNV